MAVCHCAASEFLGSLGSVSCFGGVPCPVLPLDFRSHIPWRDAPRQVVPSFFMEGTQKSGDHSPSKPRAETTVPQYNTNINLSC